MDRVKVESVTHKSSPKNISNYIKHVSLICDKCGNFKTKKIKDLKNHIDNCNSFLVDKIALENKLEIEVVKTGIYREILTKLFKIDTEDKSQLFEVIKAFQKLSPVKKDLPLVKKELLPIKKVKKYRRLVCLEKPQNITISNVKQQVSESISATSDIDNDITKCETYISQLKKDRRYNKILRQLCKQRSKLVKYLSLREYIKVVEDQTSDVEKILKDKQQSDKKVEINTLNSLSPLDARLLQYHSYTDTQLDTNCRESFEILLKRGINFPKTFVPFSIGRVVHCITNYSVAVFTIEKLLLWSLINIHGFWNIIYLPLPKSTKEDPYSFYILRTTKKNKRYWNMTCRLEDLIADIINSIRPHLIATFRKLYRDIFQDNNFRSNYTEFATFVTEDCQQLLQNIITLSRPRWFGKKIRFLIVEKCTYQNTNNDSFSLTGDDPLQRRRYKSAEKIEIVDIIRMLFDDITDSQAVDFYRECLSKLQGEI